MTSPLVLVIAGWSSLGGCAVDNPHTATDALFPMDGKHFGLECEACHGEGRPEALPSRCIDCHVDDMEAPSHYPGQDCKPCHVTDGWDVFPPPPTPPTPQPGTSGTSTGTPYTPGTDVPEHVGLHPDWEGVLCWDCHADDRPLDDGVRYRHWYDPETVRADCAPCHTLTSWEDPTLFEPEHTFRIPHGKREQSSPGDEENWVVACNRCHLDPDDYATYQCYSCHILVGIQINHVINKASDHLPDLWAVDQGCLVCHEEGTYLYQTSRKGSPTAP